MAPAAVEALRRRVADGTLHPKQAKIELAVRIVSDFHSREAAESAASEFARVHSERRLPSDLRETPVAFPDGSGRSLTRVLVDVGLASSTSDAGRKIQQGGVRLGGERCDDISRRLTPQDLPLVLQVGRHAVRLVTAPDV